MALKLSDITITEAGFGADLGAEKFMDIKCRMAGLKPDAVVLVATVRALKYNGGVPKDELNKENLDALAKGIVNLEKHIENLQKFGVPVVVTLNSFVSDTEAEYEFIRKFCEDRGCEFALAEVWGKGGDGGKELAEKYYRLWRQKKAIIIRFTVMSYQLQRRSRQSAKRFTEQRVLYMNLLQRNSLHELNQWALASSRYVWQRTSILCPMMRSFLDVRRTLISISVKSM